MMTRVQYEKQNKDLRIRLENLKIVKQISEDNLNSIIQKLKADLRSKDEQIRMLQSYIATREEAYNCLEDKYTALKEKYSELLERYESQTEAIDLLKARINKDSSNSNKPSSTDGYKKIIHNSRKPSDKKPGGQPGHKGSRLVLPDKLLEMVESGEAEIEVVDHGIPTDKYISKYEVDIKVTTTIKEHRFYGDVQIPKELRNPVNYGPNIKAICVDLSMEGLMSAERVAEFINAITDGTLSPCKATVLAFEKEMADLLDGEIEAIRESVLNAPVLNVDDTSIKSTQKPNTKTGIMDEAKGTTFNIYVSTYSSKDSVLLTVNPTKGLEGLEADLILPYYTGITMHDHAMKYYYYITYGQGECNTHIIRYLIGIGELTRHSWAEEMIALLLEILEHKKRDVEKDITSMDKLALLAYSNRYDEIISLAKEQAEALSEKSRIRKEETNLFSRMEKYKDNHLLFAYDYTVPFTNNEAERDFRWIKTQQKVSGCYRSYNGAKVTMQVMSFILTLKKRKIPLIESMLKVLSHQSVLAQPQP